MMRCHFILPIFFFSFPVTDIRADDWTEFRGSTGQGIAHGTAPIKWSPTKNIVWKQAIPGAAWSSPIVREGRIYLTTSVAVKGDEKDRTQEALCLDAGTGKLLWEKEVFHETDARAHNKNSHASPTPLINGKRLYVHFGHQGTACLDLDGNVIWRNTSLKYEPVHGNGGSPILAGNALVFSCDGSDKAFVAALDRNTGDLLWKTERAVSADRKFSFSTPLLITVNGQQQVISAGSNVVAAYDPPNGREIWRVRYDGYSVVPRPVFGHGFVFVCTGFGTPNVLAIRPDGQGDVTDSHVAWRARKSVSLTPSPVLVGDELYMVSDNGVASCLDAKTGKEHWQQRIGGNYSASPVAADGKVYFLSETGTTAVVKAAKEFRQLATNSLDERALASPAVVDGALLIRTDKHLCRVQAR